MRRPLLLIMLASVTLLPAPSCNTTPPTSAPLVNTSSTPPTCGGGASTPKGNMADKELQLVNLINSYRGTLNFPAPIAVPPDPVNVGVAQWHAQDMATNATVSLVGSDGEDPFRRIVCSSGKAGVQTGVIAVGYTTDPQAAFKAIESSTPALGIIGDATKKTSLSVGYSNGYWLVILQ